jgi:AbrB family looped-hinge helix DNA binding protein
MNTVRTKLGEGGRVIIPAAFRHDLHLQVGDEIVLHIKDNVIYITTAEQALSSLQAKVRQLVNPNLSLVDELLAVRRSEVEHE